MRVSWKLCSHSATSHPHIPPTAKHPVLLSVEGQERQRVMGSILSTPTQLGLHESREEKARERGGWRENTEKQRNRVKEIHSAKSWTRCICERVHLHVTRGREINMRKQECVFWPSSWMMWLLWRVGVTSGMMPLREHLCWHRVMRAQVQSSCFYRSGSHFRCYHVGANGKCMMWQKCATQKWWVQSASFICVMSKGHQELPFIHS